MSIPGSNVVDLVHDLLLKRKTSDPIGWQQFASQMHAANIPMELVGSVARRQHIHKRTRILTPTPKPKKKNKKKTRPLQLPDDWESYFHCVCQIRRSPSFSVQRLPAKDGDFRLCDGMCVFHIHMLQTTLCSHCTMCYTIRKKKCS